MTHGRSLARPAVGEPAPDIELAGATGQRWRLADQLGSTVVLIFHRHIH
ncbi:MAG: redoxin domain-containing protein [Ilumatobacter sp.]|nr:redoxin domain-containing protein [Ilumatobacter sp.]MDJ0768621.1 redoxin domain-containing protein [Ilumatobacter sp.]